MIHTKLLIRRLAYVPWLLAAGLVLGWAGEAAAGIDLTPGDTKVREDAGETEITVKAKVDDDTAVGANTAVALSLGAITDGGASPDEVMGALNRRFRITLPTIIIPKGSKEATATIVFTPINDADRGEDIKDDGAEDNLIINIEGDAGTGATAVNAPIKITLLDDDKLSTDLDLSFSPGDLSNEAGLTNVTVTATLNGSLSGIDHSLLLLFNNPADVDVADLPSNISSTDEILRRDSDYSASPATIDLRSKYASGKATITIDPKETRDVDAYIVLHTELDSLKGIDLNLDGDTGDSIVLTRADTTDADGNVLTGGNNVPPTDPNEVDTRRVRWSLREEALGCDAAGHRFNLVSSPGDTVPCDDFLSEDDLGIDLNGKNGVETAEHLFNMRIDSTASLKEADLKFAITANLGFFKIKNAPLLRTKAGDAGLVASPKTIREEDGRTEIELKVVLEAASTTNASVKFTIESNTDDLPGVRDVDYTVAVEDLIILAGATEGTTTLTLTPTNDSATGVKRFRVEAQVGAEDTPVGFETITITDDETLTEKITLSVSPGELKAGTGANVVTVTGTLDGQVFDEDVRVDLIVTRDTDANGAVNDDDKAAQRDTDYTAILRSLTIPAGEVKGSTTVSITPINGGDKKVGLTALESPVRNADDEAVKVSTESVVLKDADPDAEVPDPGALSFGAVDLSSTVFEYTAGTAIDPEELPEAEGGTGALTYAVSKLPAGLSFDAATRTISGTPTTAGSSSIVYTVIDSDPAGASSAAMPFTIEIGAAPVPTVGFASLASTHSSVRENGEMTVITLTATLASASDIDETVSFTIGAPSAGALAVRDVDYTAALGGVVTIAAGETQGTTTLILTPLDNAAVDGNKYLGVQVSASGGSAQTDIKIADDETPSTTISLSVSPHTISEAAGLTEVTITATLDGKVLDEAATVSVSIDGGSVATRDVDYSALFNPLLRIEAGSTSGSIALLIDPTADGEDEGNETITLNGAIAGLIGGSADITLSDAEVVAPEPEPTPLAFADGASVADVMSTAGTAIDPIELPAVLDGTGEGDVTYSVSELPAGLAFDAATRTISGTLAEVSEKTVVEVTYTATDGADATASLTFSITVNPMLDFGDLGALFGAFNGGAGKANPASEHDDRVIPFVFGQAVDLVLPEVSGGTPPLTYSVSGLPAGLSFDAATRTISGTPTELIVAAVVTYTVTDGSGASNSLPFVVAVIEPPLDAPDALVAEDYKGADGAGDQGGFVLLTWDLSEHHDGIDGYRIFRELPVLNNEMVPWAMVDAVPGVQIGRAIVATLDNVATNWGIAAERGNQTTHGAAKAAFVRAADVNQPYELMAETLLASREAAQAGDAPVFASLLPEVLAFAQGVAPKLNSVEGVLESSAITMTEEPVRAIDNIAPEAVPSLRVLDAPNDEGSRIVLTWTLSPSDRLLQGVVAEAIGPAATEPVVGVRGYGIYRRAAGEDEFVLVAQVDAGVASFVDATALNGVRYTYQVRPYDADNETGSELEQTALAVRNRVVDSEGRALFGLFGADNRVGFDDFFILADFFGLTAEDVGFDPAFDLAPSAAIDFDDFFVFADHFGRSTAAAGKRVPLFAGLNAEARLYVDARTALPSVGEDFVLDVRMADFVAVKGYGLQVQYDADKLEFVEALTDQPLGGSALAAPQVLSDEAGVLALVAHGAVVSDGEVGLRLVFRPTTEIESTVIEITDSQTYDSVGFNRLVLPAPVALQTRPAVFALANNYPNPFNPATTIRYALPQAADVELTVYNVVGQAVRTLVAEHQSAGRYVVEWDATNESGHSLSSGLYFYHLQAGGEFREVKKMLLLK